MKTKLKYLFSIFAIILIAVSSFPISQVNGQFSSSPAVGSQAYWMQAASNAWNYFQPGVGVNAATGLHLASTGYPYFTGWDLSVYLFAIMDAQQLGLISNSGTWGSDYRISKVLGFLQTMQLSSNNEPYVFYESSTGLPAFSVSGSETNACDYGSLLVALHRLEVLRPDLAGTIDNIVKVRLNTGKLASQVAANSPYDYYIANGFKYFGYDNYSAVSNALNVLNKLAALPKINVNGVFLPQATICPEPLFLGMANLDSDPALASLTYSVYLANEARYNATGKFTAFSEGNTALGSPTYVYESVVSSNMTTWDVSPPITPIAYFKVAESFLAFYNTSYAVKMVSYLEPRVLSTSSGYADGVDENGRVVSTLIDKTNGMVLDAARYAIQNGLALTPSPTSSPVPSPSPSPNPTPSSTPKSSPSPSPSPSHSPVSSLTPTPSDSPISSPSSSPTSNSITIDTNSSGSIVSPYESPIFSSSSNLTEGNFVTQAPAISGSSGSSSPVESPIQENKNTPKISESLILGVAPLAAVILILVLFVFFRKTMLSREKVGSLPRNDN